MERMTTGSFDLYELFPLSIVYTHLVCVYAWMAACCIRAENRRLEFRCIAWILFNYGIALHSEKEQMK